MSFWGRFSLCSIAVAGLLVLNGCLPSDSSQQDDEKEPHYVLGKSRVNAMDYSGAVEAFSESLEVNPRSASAHFQLACLFDTKISDPAAAIYHYQEYLRLDPKADNAEVVKQRIESCKVQLASDVNSLPSTPAAQKQVEDLMEKNRQLQAEVDKWRAYYAAQQNAPKPDAGTFAANTQGSPAMDGALVDNATAQTSSSPSSSSSSSSATRPQTLSRASRGRTHVVAAGETMASIARKYSVSLTALQAANPGVSPRRMRVGQTLNLP